MPEKETKTDKVTKTDEEWRQQLSVVARRDAARLRQPLGAER